MRNREDHLREQPAVRPLVPLVLVCRSEELEAQERVKTRWVLLVGEAVLNAVARELRNSKGKKQEWFDLLDQVLDTDVKPDDRSLYDGWKKQMQKLVSTDNDADNGSGVDATQKQKAKQKPDAEDDSKNNGDADAGSASMDAPEPIVGWKPTRLGGNEWGAILTGKPVANLPQDLLGAPIIVTDSKGTTWRTTITVVVSRDEKTVTVRDAGRPKPNRGDSPQAA